MAIASLLSLRLRILYLNRYFCVLLLVFFSLRRYRLVSFHICKASRRSSKFCLCRSLTSISRPSSFLVLHRLPRALLSFPFFLLVFFLGSYRNSRLPRRTRLHLLVLPSDLWVAENWPKRSRKNRRKSDLPSFSSCSSSSAFSASSLLLPLLRTDFLRMRATRVDSFAREGSPLLRTSNGYLPNYYGVGFLWVPEKSPWAKHGNRDAALLASLSRIPNLCIFFFRRLLDTHSFGTILYFATSDVKYHEYPDNRAFSQ